MMNLPEDFIRETRLVMGENRFNRFIGAFDEEAPVSIRLNPRRVEGGGWSENTPTAGISESTTAPNSMEEGNHNSPFSILNSQFDKVPWCPEGFYLSGRPQFTFDPLFHAGCYYVQEAASMFITHVLRSLSNLIPHSSFLRPFGSKRRAERRIMITSVHFPPINPDARGGLFVEGSYEAVKAGIAHQQPRLPDEILW